MPAFFLSSFFFFFFCCCLFSSTVVSFIFCPTFPFYFSAVSCNIGQKGRGGEGQRKRCVLCNWKLAHCTQLVILGWMTRKSVIASMCGYFSLSNSVLSPPTFSDITRQYVTTDEVSRLSAQCLYTCVTVRALRCGFFKFCMQLLLFRMLQ